MMLSESIEAATRIVDAYPNGGRGAGEGYIGALAAMLGSYPRSVATRCAGHTRGVVRVCKFLPTPADIVEWCEKETEPLRVQCDRETRVAQQLADRAEYQRMQNEERPRRLSVAELKAKYGDWSQSPADGRPCGSGPRQVLASELSVSPYLEAVLRHREVTP